MESINNNIEIKESKKILKEIFGYDSFRSNQGKIINSVVEGDNVCVLMPTGGGKSLCYQIPSLIRDGVGIIISPLIALMEDQVRALKQLNIKAETINSAMDYKEAWSILYALKNNQIDLLYIAPERFLSIKFLEILDESQIALFAIDEAHCISQWGHNFRPDYMKLSILEERYPEIPRIALTATADDATRKDILNQLQIEEKNLYIDGFDRPNIYYSLETKMNEKKQLLNFLSDQDINDNGIVYCLSRKKTEQIAIFLKDKGYKTRVYHAGLDIDTRKKHQNSFLEEEGIIMIATIAFGMGINKPDVRYVIHLDLPKSIEAYYQETGRVGRDGFPAKAHMIYSLQGIILFRRWIQDSESSEQQKRIENQKLNALLGFCETSCCRRTILLKYFGEEKEKCQNCDRCLYPPETIDGIEIANNIIQCICDTDEIFGVQYIVDVLVGKDMQRIRQFSHDRVKSYGIIKEYKENQIKSFIRQLVIQNFLYIDTDNHGGLKITKRGMNLVEEEEEIHLMVEEYKKYKEVKEVRKKQTDGGTRFNLIEDKDKILFQELKDLRLQLAQEQGVPPYMVFHDKHLMEMVKTKPKNISQMRQVPGVGEFKLKKYGEAFLRIF